MNGRFGLQWAACLVMAGGCAPAETCDGGLTVHEWGTFTTVVGSDGAELPWWTPVLEGPAVLPDFVHQVPMMSKTAAPWLVRMETPVLYFYTDKPRTVTVKVGYPGGVVTEVYPGLKAGPFFPVAVRETDAGKMLERIYEWTVDLKPPNDTTERKVPVVAEKGEHYRHARSVPEAWLVSQTGQEGVTEVEKFIFYRGAGSQALPRRLMWQKENELSLIPGSRPCFVVQSDQGALRWKKIPWDVDARLRQHVPLPLPALDASASSSREELEAALLEEVTRGGLTRAEGLAMIATWREAWLMEPGLRLLEVLPRTWVDNALPLTVEPKPDAVERVFVARIEILSQTAEAAVLAALTWDLTDEQRVERLRAANLGRFIGVAVERAARLRDADFRSHGAGILARFSAESANAGPD